MRRLKKVCVPGMAALCCLVIWLPLLMMVGNSFLQSAGTLAGQALVAVLAAWALGTMEFPGKRGLYLMYLVLMVLPFQVLMVPDYFVLDRFHLIDTHMAVILPAVFSAFPVFIMTRFFASIPKALFEAAKLDGAGEWTIFMKIGLPMGYPGILAAGILSFLDAWNAIEPAMAFLKSRTLWPLSLYLPNITADNAAVAWTASVIAMLVPLLLFLTGQTYLEQGIYLSGTKE